MKKLPGLLFLSLILLMSACKKSNDTTLTETKAHVLYGGDPVVDGMGYYIQLDGTGEDVVPLNLPSSYRQTTANTAVTVKLLDTGKRKVLNFGTTANGGLRVVYVVTIRNL